MEESKDRDPTDSSRDILFKHIGDLDALLETMLKTLPPSKPWQRQLLQELADVGLKSQVLRMNRPGFRGGHLV